MQILSTTYTIINMIKLLNRSCKNEYNCQTISRTLSIWKAVSSFQTLIVYDIEISRKQMCNCSWPLLRYPIWSLDHSSCFWSPGFLIVHFHPSISFFARLNNIMQFLVILLLFKYHWICICSLHATNKAHAENVVMTKCVWFCPLSLLIG